MRGRERAVASLSPRRCDSEPKPLEALLDCVLERLGGYWFEWLEEPLDAVDVWRSGEGDVAEWPGLERGAVR